MRKFEAEKTIVAATLKMFIVEKLYSYRSMIKSEFSEDAVNNQIGDIIGSVFDIRVIVDLNKLI